ncbi:MAG: hypothetical protein AAGA90_08200 [Actinomycetota bacterium]
MSAAVRLDPFEATLQPTVEIWSRLARPFDLTATADAVLGLSPDVVHELSGTVVATCDEAEALLAAMPKTLRNLKTSVNAQLERCVGELRGPVQWSETLAAQASSLGNRDVYICAATRRAYDIDENRVLVGALRAIAQAGAQVEREDDGHGHEADVQRARHNGRQARRFLDHRSLEAIRLEGRPTPRAIKRTRSGKSAGAYRPALAMLERAAEPLSLDEMAAFCDRRTRVQHGLLLAIMDELERRGMRVPALRAESGSLFAGPIEYVNPRRSDPSPVHGILIGNVLVDVPDELRSATPESTLEALRARAHGRVAVPVLAASDIVHAVDRAILAARGG